MKLKTTNLQQQRVDRLASLRIQANELLNDNQGRATFHSKLESVPFEVEKILEDLRIYQIELELQNEELLRSHQELELARSRHEAIFLQMPVPALILNSKGYVTRSNDRAQSLLGRQTLHATLDNRFFQNLGLPDRARLHGAIQDLTQGQPRVIEDIKFKKCDQNKIFDAHLIQLSNDYHLDDHILTLLLDKTAEVSRRKERLLFDHFLDSSDDLFFATNLKGEIVVANRALLKFLNLKKEEVIGFPRERVFPDEVAQKQLASDLVVTQKRVNYVTEEALSVDGGNTEREFLTKKFPIYDHQGSLMGVGGIAACVSLTNELKREMELSESVFQNAADAIFVTDAQRRIIRVNPAFTQLTGFYAEDVIGKAASILKPVDENEDNIRASMWSSLAKTGHWAGEMQHTSANGGLFTVWNSVSVINDAHNQPRYYVVIQTDLTQLREVQSRVNQLAFYDVLTGLPNRALFYDRLRQIISHAKRHNENFAIVYLDLDHFKEINDSLGHQQGDLLLKTVATRLREVLRSEDTAARIGGDEFVIILPSVNTANAFRTCEKILTSLHQTVKLDMAAEYRPQASLGVAIFPQDGEEEETLLRNADTAMYHAKKSGRNKVSSFSSSMGEATALIFTIGSELQTCISKNELVLFYQPKFCLKTRALVGAEALLRWNHPVNGLMLPTEFVPIAERSGFMHDLDRWVLQEAINQIAEWQRKGLWRSEMELAVNQSPSCFMRSEMINDLKSLLKTSGVPARNFSIEITEGTFLERTEDVLKRLNELNQLGIALAIDDFGTGYSSLSYLRKMPISVIKVDKAFVREMLTDEGDMILVQTIISMAHSLGKTLVAEGVESQQQADCLAQLGCEVGQGYLYGKPVPANLFVEAYLNNFR